MTGLLIFNLYRNLSFNHNSCYAVTFSISALEILLLTYLLTYCDNACFYWQWCCSQRCADVVNDDIFYDSWTLTVNMAASRDDVTTSSPADAAAEESATTGW